MVAALGLIPSLLSAAFSFAQAPPAVPALPDSERRTSYSLSGTTCACSVGFALFGTGSDVDQWLEVWVAGTRYLSTDPSHGWALTSATGTLATIPRPITDAVLTFTAVQTGTVQIVGAERPRRSVQVQENQGVPARAFNQAITDIIAQNRETWDKINDVTGRGFFAPPGQTGGIITNTGLISSLGPFTDGHLAVWNGTTGISIRDSGTISIAGTTVTVTGSVVINPPTGTNQAFNTLQVVTGAISAPLNNFHISFDQGTAGSGFSNGWFWEHEFGGGATTGGRQAGVFELIQNAATNASNVNRQYSALNTIMLANSGDGGGAGTELGFYYAFNPYLWLKAAATHAVQADIAEFDIEVDAGASILEKYGLKIVQVKADAVQGSSNDAAISVLTQAGGTAPGWKVLIQGGDGVSGQQPLAATGKVLGFKSAQTVDGGIDLATNVTCTTYCYKSNGFLIDGSGNITGNYDTGGAGNAFKIAGTAAGTVAQIQGVLSSGQLRYVFKNVNFNQTNTDNAITFALPTGVTRYAVQSVRLSTASVSISTATCGLFTSTGGGGQTIAANQAITVTATAADANNNTMSLTLTNANTEAYTDTTLQFRLGTPQGSAATADVILIITPLT